MLLTHLVCVFRNFGRDLDGHFPDGSQRRVKATTVQVFLLYKVSENLKNTINAVKFALVKLHLARQGEVRLG